jgi:hypothetical protein
MGDKSLMRAAVLASQLGFSVACPLAAFIAGGVWADGKLGTGHLLFFVGLIAGVIAAGAALYQVAAVQSGKGSNKPASGAPDKIEPGDEKPGAGQSGTTRRG